MLLLNKNSEKRNVFELHPKITLGCVMLFSLLLTDVAFSKIYELSVGYSWALRGLHRGQKIEKSYRIPSTVYHHDLKKNIDLDNAVWGTRTYRIATDSLGFKNESTKEIPLVSDRSRMLFIGDSFTEGIGVEYPHTFVGYIARQLAPRNIEVLNAGVCSYSPTIYWRKVKYLLEELGLQFDELVVFLDLSDIEDEAIRYDLSENDTVIMRARRERPSSSEDADVYKANTRKLSVRELIKRHTMLTYFTMNAIHDLFVSEPVYLVNQTRSLWTIDERLFEQFGKEGLKKAEHSMNKLVRLLQANNIPLTLVVYPWPDQILNNDLDSIQVKFWEDWAAKQQVRFLNLFPAFVQAGNDRAANMQTLQKYYVSEDMHWNENGHKLVADKFMNFRFQIAEH